MACDCDKSRCRNGCESTNREANRLRNNRDQGDLLMLYADLQSIESILRYRNGYDDQIIDEIRADCAALYESGQDPEEILADELGLEPDYLEEFFRFVELEV